MNNGDCIVITNEDIPSLDYITGLVRMNNAGAVSTFSGTTRDEFDGKRVVQLEYEAYVPMASKILHDIVDEARVKWELNKVAVYHRLGTVTVGEVSVVIATSSKHRLDSIHSTEYIIDELKERCPIWKKEVYEDGSVWKGACHKH
ncbi:Molybdopterin biosynthesis MoaE [Pilobolus umbonatus]|nr:Molybdopterin biosynthesis MoaE [Pilobolus umbonatus]